MAIRILHLDGDPAFSASVKSLLESEGMEITLTLVRSGLEFRQALEDGACDLILAGYSMPDYDGVSALMEALGCDTPDVVGNGREALAAFRGNEFDIVFMDCQMPDLDGYAATITQIEPDPGPIFGSLLDSSCS